MRQDIGRYKTLVLLLEDMDGNLYRGVLEHENKPILIKELRQLGSGSRNLSRLRHDFDILRQHHTAASPEAYAIIEQDGHFALCLEDVNGVFLSHYLKNGEMPIKDFFPIAKAMTKALGFLHAEHIIHKNLNPNNILVCENTSVKIIDFGIATTLEKETPTDAAGSSMEGNLAYMSPEQTGRMNINLDYRSDFYTLGVIFYQLLTGHLPFEQKDMLALMHAHLALMPKALNKIRPEIPKILSEIILKLLDKRPDRRYQTDIGLLKDLEKAEEMLETNPQATFDLGKEDLNLSLNISSKLYGREEDIQILEDDYRAVLDGKKHLTLVAGAPGIGKTSLVNELYKPITERSGIFIRGKYDQLQHGTPYSALSQALASGIRQLLLGTEEEVKEWSSKLNKALAPNGQIMVNIIPQLELLIGKQEAPPLIDPTQEENRLFYVFDKFMKAFATEKHPLTLFLDDLQWIDPASLKMIQRFFLGDASRWLFFVGAYRDNEVDSTHRLIYLIKQLEKEGVEIRHLTVGPLSYEACSTWLADTLGVEPKESESLAKLCFDKTAGNPFFLKQFVQTLYEDRLLHVDLEEKRWVWDAKEVERKQMTDNVIEFMSSKISRLPSAQMDLLKLASCIGNQFDMDTLLEISNKSKIELGEILWDLFQTGLILPQNEEYKYLKQEGNRNIGCYFLHDRVQEAAYSLMNEQEHQEAHLNIGRLFLKNIPESDRTPRIFDIVNQLNEGRALITAQDERENLAHLNLIATQKAIQSTAFTVAKKLIGIGLDLLGEKPWETHYPLTLRFYQYYVLVHLLLGEHELVHELAKIGIQQGKTALDRSAFYYMKTGSLSILGRFDEAVAVCFQGLKELGLSMPKNPRFYHPLINYLKMKWALRGKKIADLIDAPAIQDPIIKARVQLLTGAHLAMAFSSKFYFPIEVSLRTWYLIKYGYSEDAPPIYADAGFWLCSDELDIPWAYEFGELAIRIVKKQPNSPFNVAGIFIYNSYVAPLSHPAHDIPTNQMEVFQLSKSNTDPVWGLIALTNGIFDAPYTLGRSQNLETLHQECLKFKDYVAGSMNPFCIMQSGKTVELLRILMGLDPVPSKFIDEKELGNYQADIIRSLYLCSCASIAFSCESFDSAEEAISRALERGGFLPKSYGLVVTLYVISSLIKLALCNKASFLKKRKYLSQVRGNLKRIKKRMMLDPKNFEHFYLLIQAELARVLEKDDQAEILYSQAIKKSEERDYIWALALSNELASKYYLSRNKVDIARFYMQEALKVYSNWGALGKVRQLQALYPSIAEFKSSSGTGGQALDTSSGAIDLLTVVKANQAISEEIQLPKLLEKMLGVVLENAGAELAFFLEKKNNRWEILAKMKEEDAKLKFKYFSQGEAEDDFPKTIINFCVRTLEPLVLPDASKSDEFGKDPYISENKIKSILCLPILHHNEMNGLIYLENNLTAGAFTADRLAVLKSVSAQIAISLQNSRYLDHVERVFRSTERFVPKRFLEILQKQNIEEVVLGDSAKKEISVLFNDIRSFTTLVENRSPEEAFAFVNRYWKFMAPIIRKHEGYIDQYQGDAILAIFPNKPEDCLLASIAMMNALGDFNKEQEAHQDVAISMGIGMSTGPAMLGIIGEEERQVSGLISDVANTAARVEGLNKLYSSRILFSNATENALPKNLKVNYRQVDKVRLKGKKQVTEIYEVIEWDKELKNISLMDYLKHFHEAFELYLKGEFKLAEKAFSECLELFPNDNAAKLLQGRCQSFLERGLPSDWDGAYRLTEK